MTTLIQLRDCDMASTTFKPLPVLGLTTLQFIQMAALIHCDWLSAYVLNFPNFRHVCDVTPHVTVLVPYISC